MNVFQIPPSILSLIINVSLLLSLTMLYSYIRPLLQRSNPNARPLIKGVLFGLFGVIDMAYPAVIAPGILFDGRNIMIALAGAFGGLKASLTAAAIVIIVRVFIGGAGVPFGIAGVMTSALLGYGLLGRRRQGDYPSYNAQQLLGLGAMVALQQVFWTYLASPPVARATFFTLAFEALLLFPAATLLIGKLLSDQNLRFSVELVEREAALVFDKLDEQLRHISWIADDQGKILHVSSSFETLTRQSREQLLENPHNFLQTIHPEDRARITEKLLHPNGEYRGEFRFVLPDGSVRWVSAQTHTIRDRQGRIFRIAGFAEDITERKAVEAQKLDLEAERARIATLRDFIADASHDIGTPLSVMQTSLYLLRRTTSDQRQLSYVGRLQEQADRLQNMIANMLLLARLDMGSSDRELMATDINSVAEIAVAVKQSQLDSKGQQLQVNLDPASPHAWADPSELELAIEHLLDNAIKFSDEGRPIEISITHGDHEVTIAVRDHGIGIPQAELPRVFERFYRVDKARGSDTGGNGLGLAIAQKVVQFAGGRIDAESTVGAGSTFRIVLRRSDPDDNPIPGVPLNVS